MSAPGIKTVGFQELRKELRALNSKGLWTKELAKASKRAVKRAVVPPMRRNAPRGATGKLSRSPRPGQTSAGPAVLIGSEGAVPYAGPINFGWAARNIEAQEFIYRTLQDEEQPIVEVFAVELDRIVRRAFPSGRL